jgi:hypothetical protein
MREQGVTPEGDSRTVVNDRFQAWREKGDSMVGGELSGVEGILGVVEIWVQEKKSRKCVPQQPESTGIGVDRVSLLRYLL